jgi:hypothetical protein
MKLTCSIHLRPVEWQQSVEHYPSINMEGRRFSANFTIERGSELRLSNKMRLTDLAVQIQIFEVTRMQGQMAKLPPGSIGSFSFYDAMPPHDDIPGMDPFLSAWFVLNAQSLDDVWNQVQQGGYSECSLMVEIGPVESDVGPGWMWDVSKSPHLVIDAVTLSFKRSVPTLGESEEKKGSSFWQR